MKGQRRDSKGPAQPDTLFTDDEVRRLKAYAEANGLKGTEEAHQELSKAELARRYKVTRTPGVVIPIKGSKGPAGERNG